MERHEALAAKYQALVSEWSTIFIASSVLFASAIVGLVFGLIYFSLPVIVITILLMFVFALFEYRSRTLYVKAKREIERELFKAGGKKEKELVERGLVW